MTSLQQRVGHELMARPLGTSLSVPLLSQRYFLVPHEATGPDRFRKSAEIDLMCAPCDAVGISYGDTLNAWLSPYAGHDRLESIEMALRSALNTPEYDHFDLDAARRALAAAARIPFSTPLMRLQANLAQAA